MAISLTYASNVSSGPSAGVIGWINWGTGFTLTPGTSTTGLSVTYRNGYTMTFDLSCTNTGTANSWTATVPPTYPGAQFGNPSGGGYYTLSGPVVLYSKSVANTSLTAILSNISVKDSLGNPISNYSIFCADGEATATGETVQFVTNGNPFTLFDNIGNTTSPAVSGIGTTTATFTGNSLSGVFGSNIVETISPTQISGSMSEGSVAGLQGIAFGLAISTIQLNKVISNRYFASDQFILSISSGTISSTTITAGAIYGTQTQYVQTSALSGNTYTLNESMAPGSSSSLSQYKQTIAWSNSAPGGTPVPTSTTIPGNITIAPGDIIVATITNSILPVTVTSTKYVSKNFADTTDTLTYTIELRNTSNSIAQNVYLIDTIPNNTTYQPSTLKLNGSPISGNPAPPNGVNIGSIGANSVVTVTFDVTINNTIPNPNPIVNTASGNFIYSVLPITGVYNTNSVSTRVNSVILTSTKSVDKTYAKVGDTLTYTVRIANSGSMTASNIVFIDTIPSGTTLIGTGILQDSTPVTGSPNPPGLTLPNPIAPGGVSTVTFQVIVNTIPNPNPIPNSAAQTYQYTIDSTTTPNRVGSGSADTNTVTTQVNNASLGGINKGVSVSYATCGDILTYTITLPNSGNVTANNVVLRDTIPNGTSLVPSSVYVNGTQQPPSTNPQTGVTVGTIAPGSSSVVTFQVKVNC